MFPSVTPLVTRISKWAHRHLISFINSKHQLASLTPLLWDSWVQFPLIWRWWTKRQTAFMSPPVWQDSKCFSIGLRGLCSDRPASYESHFLVVLDICCCINSVDNWNKMLKIFGMGKHTETTTTSQKTLTVCTLNSMGKKNTNTKWRHFPLSSWRFAQIMHVLTAVATL